ncbi:MAG: SDR family NAD(P)-dependent oxidoreductase, partial [Pseudomonadota bacterium]
MTDAVFPDLKGASVVVTGGGSGIGAALTEGFLRQGAKVAFLDIADGSDFAAQLEKETGATPLFLPCDVTDVAALRAAINQTAEAHGPVKVLVNNA